MRSKRDRRSYGRWQGSVLRKVRTKEKAKNGSVRVPDGCDFLGDVERVGKDERSMESERMNEGR